MVASRASLPDANRHQMEYLVPAPQWSPRSGGRGRRVAWLDHPFDHPDDPTGSVWIRLNRRPIQREQARSGADQIDAEHQATDPVLRWSVRSAVRATACAALALLTRASQSRWSGIVGGRQ